MFKFQMKNNFQNIWLFEKLLLSLQRNLKNKQNGRT